MKKFLSLILCVVLLAVCVPMGMFTVDVSAATSVSGYYSYTVTDGKATITDCDTSISGAITIPSTMGGYPVTAIGNDAFYCCNFESITIPDSVTLIGDNAFAYCIKLAEVHITDLAAWCKINFANYCAHLSDNTYDLYLNDELIADLKIPDTITEITPYLFYHCTSLKRVTIPDSVTSIGSAAFGRCNSLENVTIGNSVTSIGGGAFSYCSSLKSITIPNSVTSIGGDAFYGTAWFKNQPYGLVYAGKVAYEYKGTCPSTVIIKDGTLAIADHAFSYCSNLKSITIPDSVTNIDEYAFYCCTSLVGVTMGNRVTTIGEYAFYGCISLASSITIPDSVTEIGSQAFYHCTSLASIAIPGSVTEIGGSAFEACTSLASIAIPGSVTKIGGYAFRGCNNLVIYCQPGSIAEQYAIADNIPYQCCSIQSVAQLVADSNTIGADFVNITTGKTVSSVTATYQNGRLCFAKTGFYSAAIDNSTVTDFSGRRLAVVPQSSGSGIAAVHCKGQDILAESVAVNDTDSSFDLYVYAAAGTAVQPFYLETAGGTALATAADGHFVLDPAVLPVDTVLYVRGDGLKRLKINLTVQSAISFDFKNNEIFEIPVPDDVPLIGGTKLKLSTKNLPISWRREGNKLQIAIGTTCDLKEGKLDFYDYKKAVDQVADYEEMLADGIASSSTPFAFGLETTICGYAEIICEHGSWRPNGGRLTVLINGSAKKDWQFVAWVIPIVVKFKAEGELKAGLTLGLDSNHDFYITGDCTLTVPKLTLSGGAGISKVADISVYGSAVNEIYVNFREPYSTGTLKGELGLSATALFLSGKWKLLSGEWRYYDTRTITTAAAKSGGIDFKAMLTDAGNYCIDRSHLAQQSEWLGAAAAGKPEFAAGNDAYQVSRVKKLQTAVYNDAKPQTATLADGTVLMVWVADLATRSSGNHTAVVWSKYDADNDAWSAPQVVEDDGTADFDPAICTDGTDICLVWTDAKRTFDEDVTLESLAKGCEISAAYWDAQAEAFTAAQSLTDNEIYDGNATVAMDAAGTTVSWTANSSGDILKGSGTNTVNRVRITGKGTVQDAFCAETTPVSACCTGQLNGETVTAYVTDGDGDSQTTEDTALWLVQADGETVTAESGSGVYAPQFAEVNGVQALLWADGSRLKCKTDSAAATVLIDDFAATDFSVIGGAGQTAIVCSRSDGEEDGSDVYAYLYNGTEWSAAVQITDDGGYAENPNGYFDADGKLRIVFAQKEVVFSDADFSETTNLCDATVAPHYNLTVDRVDYDAAGVLPDTAMPVTVGVTNNGLYAVDAVTVTVTDAAGNACLTQTVSAQVGVGETADVSFDFTMPAGLSAGTEYTVTVTPQNHTDACLADNSGLLRLGYSDLSVQVTRTESGYAVGADVSVTNNGQRTENVKMRVRDGSADGDVLAVYLLGDIAAGQTADYRLDAQYFRALERTSDCLYFEIYGGGEEEYSGDNTDYITYDCPQIAAIGDKTVPYYFDLNGDETFDVRDLVRMKKLLAQSEEQSDTADVNGDFAADAQDVALVRKKLLVG